LHVNRRKGGKPSGRILVKDVVLIDKLSRVVENKYEAVRVMAKEARRINDLLIRGAQGEISIKPTSVAMKRLMEKKIKYQYVEETNRDFQMDDEDEE
jgi:DNA-directed RNA polymerase subunit K/omega